MVTDEMISLWTFPLEAAAGCEKVLLAMLILEAKYKWHFHRNKFFKVTLLDCETPSLQEEFDYVPVRLCLYLLQFSGPTPTLGGSSHTDGSSEQQSGWRCSAGLPRPISAHSELLGTGNWMGLGWLVLAQVQGGSATCQGARHSEVLTQLEVSEEHWCFSVPLLCSVMCWHHQR